MTINKKIDRQSQQKLYVQASEIIEEKIALGEWPAGSQIPTEDELCRIFNVSKATIRMAISDLERKGSLKKKQGKGTFVTYRAPDLGLAMKTRLTEGMFGEGVNVRKEILVKGAIESTEDVRACLNSHDAIYYILCKRVVDGEPAYLEESYISLTLFPGIEEEDICQTPLYDLIQQRAGKIISKVVQTIEVAEIRGDAASILKTDEGTPVLLLHRILVGADGSPIAYTRLTGSGRKYKIQTELERIA
ncbi:MAG: hypothetical protein A2X56_05700 [Nitrospirae bacterium GWC2_57_13]|jgi:DNA-binding GntR family transcriptional regulator|nr:MAG: hypothetical protein A2X56_05700 [Nitrospirae bacterium GWC2_57_13]HAS53763.1 hypothetical protein [Nitrospiraceae bacterium]